MREKKNIQNKTELYCNGCGKRIASDNGIIREGILQVDWDWGYFSEKDGETHSFCLCEKCYDRIRSTFAIPVQVGEYLPFSGRRDEEI